MLYLILAIILSIIITFYRLIKGPSVPDRLAAMNSIGVMFLMILVLLSYYFERKIYINVALVYGVSIFMNVLIMVKYLQKPEKGGSSD
ncbi:multicomponent Na+:H+ antiporter subunit F [Orenia metallireducens]|jgi:multicomponent Na+:H+ antiporter subunit F|uniref:Multicomponent Na+:H+ antiporter subunit F n=1 Tax=Orenia metallireducens TaxID=1413210 RepID=A0A285GVR9_9FIRM|nr:monovalent cation/H+ antiporter complex subunit F [Orenia metallireducens]PRX32636.1 multicomponent Na+:H+ antiporter subunit F [Orenia metallireducens]SNY26626.1 multicomponent Na+:H+ antiporter subunit F [Orenia metallireducens]